MKEPKYSKFKDNRNQNKNYNFFQEALFPEKKDEQKLKNKSSQKKNQHPLFSLPQQIDRKSIPNTQKEDDILPFFAKDYPSSSESKEDICFINSPLPSNTYTYSGGEAEEIEGIEEEDNEDKSNITNEKEKKNNKPNNSNNNNNNLNNDEKEKSVDYNSELEEDQDIHSKMMSREEMIERLKIQEEKKREEKRKKEEEERIKREEEKRKKKKKKEKKRKKKKEKEKKKKKKRKKKKKKGKKKKKEGKKKKKEKEKNMKKKEKYKKNN